MKPASALCGVLAAMLTFPASPLVGQRIQFPSAVPTNTAPAVMTGAPYGTVPGSSAGTSPPYGASTAPVYGPGGPGATPSYPMGPTAGSGAEVAPSYGPGFVPGPTATFQGDIQPAPTWDPYATPGAPPGALCPQDPTMPVFPGSPSNTITTMKRFLQEIRLDYVWIPGTASNEFGVNDAELSAEFAIPFLRNPQTPLLITPGFAIHYWNGPETTAPPFVPPDLPPLPSRAYDAYLDAAWNPQLSRIVGGELAFRIGVYSDFGKVVNESIRYRGHGLGVISLTPSFQLKAGVVYLDRNRIKLLPAGGIVWTPNDDVRFEILFPNPKLAVRLPGYSRTEWWLYARGEYGGGAWTVEVDPVAPFNRTEIDYNDLRVAVGLDFETVRGLNGLFEVGLTFEREIFYRFLAPVDPFTFRPDPTVFVRGGLAY